MAAFTGRSGAMAQGSDGGSFSDPDKLYTMPAHFGGRPGGQTSTTYWDTDTASVFYETEAAALERFLPGGFSLLRPEVMLASMMNRGVEWMGGEPYNILAMNFPVTYAGNKDNLDGWFSLVVWENNTTPILTGRELTGIPKIPAEIEDFRFLGTEMRTWAHAHGHTFCDLHFTNIRDATKQEHDVLAAEYENMNWIGWRHIPSVGAQGGADISQPVLFPQEFYPKSIFLAEANLEWHVPPQWRNPTQHHIIAQIAALPVLRQTRPAVVLKNAKNVLRGDLARILE